MAPPRVLAGTPRVFPTATERTLLLLERNVGVHQGGDPWDRFSAGDVFDGTKHKAGPLLMWRPRKGSGPQDESVCRSKDTA